RRSSRFGLRQERSEFQCRRSRSRNRVRCRLRNHHRTRSLILRSAGGAAEYDSYCSCIVDHPIGNIFRQIEHDSCRLASAIAVKRRANALYAGGADVSFLEANGVLDSVKINHEAMWLFQFEIRVLCTFACGDLGLERVPGVAEGDVLNYGCHFRSRSMYGQSQDE